MLPDAVEILEEMNSVNQPKLNNDEMQTNKIDSIDFIEMFTLDANQFLNTQSLNNTDKFNEAKLLKLSADAPTTLNNCSMTCAMFTNTSLSSIARETQTYSPPYLYGTPNNKTNEPSSLDQKHGVYADSILSAQNFPLKSSASDSSQPTQYSISSSSSKKLPLELSSHGESCASSPTLIDHSNDDNEQCAQALSCNHNSNDPDVEFNNGIGNDSQQYIVLESSFPASDFLTNNTCSDNLKVSILLEKEKGLDDRNDDFNSDINNKCIVNREQLENNSECENNEALLTKNKGDSKSDSRLPSKQVTDCFQLTSDNLISETKNNNETSLVLDNRSLEQDYCCKKLRQINKVRVFILSPESIIQCNTCKKHILNDNINCQAKDEKSTDILYSRHLNKKLRNSKSRLKPLEEKLKNAGLTDCNLSHSENDTKVTCYSINVPSNNDLSSQDSTNNTQLETNKLTVKDDKVLDVDQNKQLTDLSKCHQYIPPKEFCDEISQLDSSPNSTNSTYIDYSVFNNTNNKQISLDSNQNVIETETFEDLIPETCAEFSQFNVSDLDSFAISAPAEFYDNFCEDSSSSETSCSNSNNNDDVDDDYIFVNSKDKSETMVKESEKSRKHNPNLDNLKSLLKKPGRTKKKKSNRVVFNETKNEFFDADYIILIREECDFEEDEEDSVCTCNQHEMVRLGYCDSNCCNCQMYDGYDKMPPPSPKYAPPIEFVDSVTLSPPEGYKDMELLDNQRAQQRHHQQRNSAEICFECNVGYEEEEEDEEVVEEQEIIQSDSEIEREEIQQQQEATNKAKTDQSQQTTPTTPPNSETTETLLQNQQMFDEVEDDVNKTYATYSSAFSMNQKYQSSNSAISGILKGGRLYKHPNQQNVDVVQTKSNRETKATVPPDLISSDDEVGNKRSVRFIESDEAKEKRDNGCDGAAVATSPEEELCTVENQNQPDINAQTRIKSETFMGCSDSVSSPETSPEMILTFKLGNHVLISNNSLKPNSAVRQLFPCTKGLVNSQELSGDDTENSQKYLVTAESLRAFEEAKRSKLPQIIQSGETDETIKRAIERNTLRRSLIRYGEPRTKKQPYKSDNSLVERIKQLTCDVDDNVNHDQMLQRPIQEQSVEDSLPHDIPSNRSSPPGEESRKSPNSNVSSRNRIPDKNYSPSSSSTTSQSSTSASLTHYRQALNMIQNQNQKAVEPPLLSADTEKLENIPDIQNNLKKEAKHLPDISNNHPVSRSMLNQVPDLGQYANPNKMDTTTAAINEARRQFLSTLAPLTACVTMGITHSEDSYYNLSSNTLAYALGERVSLTSSGTEYSLEDIDEGLKHDDNKDQPKRIAPDVLVGTPSASESGDELAMFVQQEAGRTEKIKKKYHLAESQETKESKNEEDDENDDYGFNKRPSVQGIKPRCIPDTNDILPQIQNQLQPPPKPGSIRMSRPYYSESGITKNSRPKNGNYNTSINYHCNNPSDGMYYSAYAPSQLRSAPYIDNNLYSNCSNQKCVSKQESYDRNNMNALYSTVRVNNDSCQPIRSPNRHRHDRPQSPPPMEMSKQYHQTMFYIPYDHIESCQPPMQYFDQTITSTDYISRVSNQNQINTRYVEPHYQSRPLHSGDDYHHHHHHDHQYNVPTKPPKIFGRVSYVTSGQNHYQHLVHTASNSPVQGHSTARSTQTPSSNPMNCTYYPVNTRCRPVWQGDEGNYVQKMNRHSFPLVGPKYQPADSISLTDSDSQHSGSLPNGYMQSMADLPSYNANDSLTDSPTKSRFNERGVPEGAASVSPQDLTGQNLYSSLTSPTSFNNPLPPLSPSSTVPNNQKPLYYAMNI